MTLKESQEKEFYKQNCELNKTLYYYYLYVKYI